MNANSTPFEFPLTTSLEHLIEGRSDARLRRLLYEITALASRIEYMRSKFAARLDLSPAQFSVLMHIGQNQASAPQTVTRVAQDLHVSTAYITQESRALIQKGLLNKAPNPDDGRSVILTVSDAGATAIKTIAPVLRDTNDHLFASLSTKSFETLSNTLHDMIQDAETALAHLPSIMSDRG